MATQDIAQQLVDAAQQNPQLISQLTSNPSSTVKSVTGLDLSSKEITEVVTCATKLAKGESVDMGTVASLAADLFSKHGGDLTKIMGSLLGGGDDSSDQQDETTETTTSNGKKKKTSKKTEDEAETASDDTSSNGGGVDLGEVANIAESLLGGSSSSSHKKTSKSDGLDLGEVASIAESLFGGK